MEAKPTLRSVTINGKRHVYTEQFGPYRLDESDESSDESADSTEGDESSESTEASDNSDSSGDESTETEASDSTDSTEGDESTEAPELPEIPVVAEGDAIQEVDEDELRSQFSTLTDARAARVAPEVERTPALAGEVTGIADAQQRIADEINRRRSAATEADEAIEAAPVVEIPEPVARPAARARGTRAAAVADARRPQQRRDQEPPQSRADRPNVVLTAAVGISDSLEGDEVDFAQLGEAIEAHKDTPGALTFDPDGRSHRDGGIVLAGLPGFTRMAAAGADVPEVLDGRVGIERVDELIRETQDAFRGRRSARRRGEDVDPGVARTATICDPLEPIRQIPSAFTDEERVSPTFPSRPVGRGGFQFTPSIDLVGVSAGTRTWTEADQAAVDPTNSATWKPIVDVNCGVPVPVKAEAVTYGIRYDNTTEMSSPERVQNAMAALQAARARQKEGRILQLLDSTLSAYAMESDFGAIPAFIDTINSLIPILKYANRLEEGGYTVVIPEGLVAALGVDLAKKANAETDFPAANVLSQLQASLWGVDDVVIKLDAARGGLEPGAPPPPVNPVGQPAVDVPTLDDTYRVRIYDPSGYIYGETGQQNVGTLRDSQTVRQNKTIFFGEEYLLLAKNGPQPGAFVDVNLCANGQRAGLLTPVGCNPGT